MNKHVAEYEGQTFTRNSKGRRYSHCVVARNNFEMTLRLGKINAAVVAKGNYDWYCKRSSWTDYAGHERVMEGAACKEEFLNLYPTIEDYVAATVNARVESLEKQRAAGEFDRFWAVGWTGRRDLAVKLMNRTLNQSSTIDKVVILDATIL